MKTRQLTLAVGLLLAATACSGNPTGSSSSPQATAPASDASAGSTTPGLQASVPPLGKDLACFDRQHCYLKNPRKLTDTQLRSYFTNVPGAQQAPAASMRPWAYVVLDAGSQVLVAHASPSAGSEAISDDIGIRNHRAVFAFCRKGSGSGAWYRVEGLSPSSPATVWLQGGHLVAYGHDGDIPSC